MTRHRNARRWIAGGAAAVTVASLTTVLAVPGDPAGAATTAAVSRRNGVRTGTATVKRRDLVERESIDGTLGYADARTISSPRQGTLTGVRDAGTVVERGQSLFEVDGRAVPLLYGVVPMYRTLSTGVDDGYDVLQLEANLVALGFATSSQLKVDGHFDAATAAAVKRWQKTLGVDETGSVGPNDFVFEPGAVRVTSVHPQLGASVGPGAAVYDATGTDRVVTLRLDAARQSLVHVGDPEQVELPDGSVVDAAVSKVGAVATKTGQESTPNIDVELKLADPAKAGTLDSAPVTVRLTKASTKNALVVPVAALLALSEGGYAVEVVDGGRHRLVGVTLGAFADGSVAVQGRLHAGDVVVVPR
ncbi:MAG TPA: peptidoglycan-binding protein [Acidimicrobiia bacterium]|nr:peptidoglycan-binding protein [Acidimicrobiia bacterium]